VRASKLLPLPFANPAPFEPGAVAKIAPSVDLARTMLGVWPDETGHLRVWGLVHAGDRRFGIDLEIAPSFLRVVGLGPGVLSVSYGERHVIAYARGEAHFPERAELDVRRVLSTGIDTFHSRELGRLAERMLLHGHGGTILLLEPGVKPEALTHHPHYTFRPPNAVLRDAFKRDEDIRQNRVGPEAGESTEQFVRRRVLGQRERAGALNHVARLTAVDGAVVMTTALDVIGYGATIATGTTDAPRLRLLDPRKKTAEPVDVPFSILTGHRHKSAACFCAAQSGVGVAIVASQDGVLSLFGREADGAVLVVRPITV
jgi:hypothetical protein